MRIPSTFMPVLKKDTDRTRWPPLPCLMVVPLILMMKSLQLDYMGISFPPDIRFHLTSLIHHVDGLDHISRPFSKEENDHVFKNIMADRALGPDGFNGQFLKVYWNIIALDFYKLCDDF